MNHFAETGSAAIALQTLTKDSLEAWLGGQPDAVKKWIAGTGYKAEAGTLSLLPEADGGVQRVLLGVSETFDMWTFGGLATSLPAGVYQIDPDSIKQNTADEIAIAFALGTYHFDRYKSETDPIEVQLMWPADCDRDKVTRTVEATNLARDLINIPADHLGPSELEAEARTLADRHGGEIAVTTGDDLITQNYPAVHAIGRASDDAPRLIDIKWGDKNAPSVTLVGKGVCFDTGGLDIKPAAGMKLMKKDMGGAAHVLGIAHMLMSGGTPVRLRVLIPAVENNIDGNAIRPMDVIKTRSGKTVEIGHTDAEGRVILADALCEAAAENPELIVDFATLTGAARVALGAELPALFCNDDAWAERFLSTGIALQDPLWRLPLWAGYQKHIKGKSADLTNAPEISFGGAITAALFLQEFTGRDVPWAHIDLMAWNASAQPGRPEGGEAMAMRAVAEAISDWAASRS